MKTTSTARSQQRPDAPSTAADVEQKLHQMFTPDVIDELRVQTGYNPRQRVATAFRLMLTVVEAFLVGQTLSFTALRAIFARRFGVMRPCPFQRRFKQAEAGAFFRAALERIVASVVKAAGLELSGPLAAFADVRIYDGTGQRVPPRGRDSLPSCSEGRAGTKWLMGYSIKTGLLEHGAFDAETASETPLWRRLVPSFTSDVLYLFDLGFFERRLFAEAKEAGAHVLMRLKSSAKVRVTGHIFRGALVALPNWALGYYLQGASRARGTLFDLDVTWGKGKELVALRLVGFAHTANNIRWYLTTVPRSTLSAEQIVQSYRLRWLIELLFREIKQAADLGRAFTANRHAIEALTYGAMIAHVLVRSLRVQAALANEVPLEQLRPLACLHVARAFASEIVDALAADCAETWARVARRVGKVLIGIAREVRPSRSRPRIALKLGAIGA